MLPLINAAFRVEFALKHTKFRPIGSPLLEVLHQCQPHKCTYIPLLYLPASDHPFLKFHSPQDYRFKMHIVELGLQWVENESGLKLLREVTVHVGWKVSVLIHKSPLLLTNDEFTLHADQPIT